MAPFEIYFLLPLSLFLLFSKNINFKTFLTFFFFLTFYITLTLFYYILNKKLITIQIYFMFPYKLFQLYITLVLFSNHSK
jgi:hypothetical protein